MISKKFEAELLLPSDFKNHPWIPNSLLGKVQKMFVKKLAGIVGVIVSDSSSSDCSEEFEGGGSKDMTQLEELENQIKAAEMREDRFSNPASLSDTESYDSEIELKAEVSIL